MLTFRPISYDPTDYVSFKYIGTSSIREGQLCYAAQNNLAGPSCTQFKGISPATVPTSGSATVLMYQSGKYFPVFREDPDVESTVGTIAKNEYVISFPLRPGVEFEVHKSITETGTHLTDWTSTGQQACLGSNGKWTPVTGTNATGLVLAECMGTLNATWLRLRSI